MIKAVTLIESYRAAVFIILAIILSLLINNRLFSQEKVKSHPDLILVGKPPAATEILNLKMHHLFNKKSILNKSEFLKLLDNAKSVQPNDELLNNWNYAPWYSVNFITSSGNYEIELYLGGLGIMTLPNGKKGAIMLDLKKK